MKVQFLGAIIGVIALVGSSGVLYGNCGNDAAWAAPGVMADKMGKSDAGLYDEGLMNYDAMMVDDGGRGMMDRGAISYGMIPQTDAVCPMTMNMGLSTDYLLAHRSELKLSRTQVAKFEKIGRDYRNDVAQLYYDLETAMAGLHDLLNESKLNIVKITAASNEVGKIENRLRQRNVSTYIAAKLALTDEQRDKVMEMNVFDVRGMHCSRVR